MNTPSLDLRDFWCLAPAVILACWGLVVVAADLSWAGRREAQDRRKAVGLLAMTGVALALVSAFVLTWIDVTAATAPERLETLLGGSLGAYFSQTGDRIFLGTLSRGLATDVINVLLTLLLGFVVAMSSAHSFTDDLGEFLALLLWATVGMMILAASEELATLFLALETMTICLYLAAAFEKSRRRSPEAGLKYFIYGSVSSALFLYGLSLVYGLTGSTYFDAIGDVLGQGGPSGLTGDLAGGAALLLILAGFGFKLALVPFHQWAPDVYEGAPAPAAAWIATGSKIAAFFAFLKVFLHALAAWSNPTGELMGPGWVAIAALVAGVTMTYGNLAALVQTNYKRMLGYSSIAHGGYLLVGIVAASVSTDGATAVGAALYYLVVYAFATIGAFAVAAWLARDKGDDAIDDLDGLSRTSPALAACVVVLMFSLIGVPPFAGFFGKLYIFMEGLHQQPSTTRVVLTWLVALGLFNSVASAFYYLRVLRAMYLRPPSKATGGLKPAGPALAWPIAVSAVVVTVLGLASEPFIELMRSAARPMLTTSASTLELPEPAPVTWLPSPLSE